MSVSEEFYDSILDSGCLVQTCGICGKIHFCTEAPSRYEVGELQELHEKAKKDPDKYVEHKDADTVHCGMFHGRIIVYKCCEGWLEDFERFFWKHRHQIKKYLDARSKKEFEEAQSQYNALKGGE